VKPPVVFWKNYIRRERTSSWIPIVGGLCGVAAALIVPFPLAKQFWWLPLLLDWGSLPGLSYTLIYLKHLTSAQRNPS
jgi:hypothetical protein